LTVDANAALSLWIVAHAIPNTDCLQVAQCLAGAALSLMQVKEIRLGKVDGRSGSGASAYRDSRRMDSHRAIGLKAQFPAFRGRALHYLDSAATAQMPQSVIDAVNDYDIHYRANVHGEVHELACRAVTAYWDARASVARLINAASPREVIFTYGATSSINLLAATIGETLQPGDEIVLSVLEHHSNLVPWQQLAKRRGVMLRFLGITEDGRIDGRTIEREVTGKCRLIAVTHCSNVTGAITEVEPLVTAARAVGAKIFLDGAQAIPHLPVDVHNLGIDFYAFSGHKLYAPTGIGVLWGRYNLLAELRPFMTGGQMTRLATLNDASFTDPPQRFEAGTPPIGAAIGLGAAAEWAMAQDWKAIGAEERRLTERLLNGLSAMSGFRIIGPMDTSRRLGVISFVTTWMEPLTLCRVLDDRGVAVRYGDHCARPLMTAMGIEGAHRASLAPYVDDSDVDALLETLVNALH
jgi:cysteine desulfurase/selenocysteine lyase